MSSGESKLSILLLFFSFANLSSYSQTRDTEMEDSLINLYNTEGVTIQTSIETLVYLHYQALEGNSSNNCALFYYEKNGTYSVKASIFYNLENSVEMVSNTNTGYSQIRLESEVKFKELDRNWIKKQLLENSDKDQANFIYYNEVEKEGVFRTYKLFN